MRRMSNFAAAFHTAFALIGGFDADLRDIVFVSLAVSLSASACAFAIGAPLGTALAVYRFPGRSALVVIVNALLGLPFGTSAGCGRTSRNLASRWSN